MCVYKCVYINLASVFFVSVIANLFGFCFVEIYSIQNSDNNPHMWLLITTWRKVYSDCLFTGMKPAWLHEYMGVASYMSVTRPNSTLGKGRKIPHGLPPKPDESKTYMRAIAKKRNHKTGPGHACRRRPVLISRADTSRWLRKKAWVVMPCLYVSKPKWGFPGTATDTISGNKGIEIHVKRPKPRCVVRLRGLHESGTRRARVQKILRVN